MWTITSEKSSQMKSLCTSDLSFQNYVTRAKFWWLSTFLSDCLVIKRFLQVSSFEMIVLEISSLRGIYFSPRRIFSKFWRRWKLLCRAPISIWWCWEKPLNEILTLSWRILLMEIKKFQSQTKWLKFFYKTIKTDHWLNLSQSERMAQLKDLDTSQSAKRALQLEFLLCLEPTKPSK